MRWESKDIDMYLKAKEYVDTVVIPLLPISFGDDMKQVVNMGEFISLLTPQVEKQFKGRILMLPGKPYLKTSDEELLLADLSKWEEQLKESGFKHIFYITSDSDWKLREDRMKGSLVWLPSLPLESMDEKYKLSILEDQVKQLLQLFVQKWQNS